MSLEQALAANTAALQALTAALSSGTVLPQSIGAPSTAAVAPVPTAPAASTDSSPAPTTAFAQPVPTPPSTAATAAPPTVPPAAGVERDSKGMPWDGRIHSSTKAKVANGSWRYKRGVDDTVIKPIEAELRAAAGAPAAPPVVGIGTPWPFPSEPVAAAPAAPIPVIPAPPAAPAVAAPPPVAPVAVPVAVSAAIGSYEQLMAALPPKIVSGELTATQLQQACEAAGVPSIAALQSRPDLVAMVAATLRL